MNPRRRETVAYARTLMGTRASDLVSCTQRACLSKRPPVDSPNFYATRRWHARFNLAWMDKRPDHKSIGRCFAWLPRTLALAHDSLLFIATMLDIVATLHRR